MCSSFFGLTDLIDAHKLPLLTLMCPLFTLFLLISTSTSAHIDRCMRAMMCAPVQVPQWSSPGYRGSMTGTMSDVTFAEAIVKLPHCGTTRAAARATA